MRVWIQSLSSVKISVLMVDRLSSNIFACARTHRSKLLFVADLCISLSKGIKLSKYHFLRIFNQS